MVFKISQKPFTNGWLINKQTNKNKLTNKYLADVDWPYKVNHCQSQDYHAQFIQDCCEKILSS